MDRPVGVIILSILQALGAVLSIILGVLLCVGAEFAIDFMLTTPEFQESFGQLNQGDADAVKTGLLIVGILIILFSLFGLFYAFSLWQLSKWAWYFTVVIQGLSLGLNALVLLATGLLPDVIFSVMIAAVILVYFFRRKVKYAFGIGGRRPSPQAIEDDTDF